MARYQQHSTDVTLTRRSFLAASVAGIISPEPREYRGWATAALRSNGEVLVVYSGGREAHVCPFGRVEMVRSRDGGETWSWPEMLMDSPIDDRDAGVCETASGALLVTTFTSLAYEKQLENTRDWAADRLARWMAVQRRSSPRQRQTLLGCWMLRSEDGGMSWSSPYRVPVNSPHGPVALTDGRLLYAGKQLWEGGRVGVCESRDDGRNWRWLAEIPVRPGDSAQNYHELHAVEAADGTLIVQIRNHNETNKGETLQCISRDGGRNWSVPGSIGVWGLPSHLLRLRNGLLLMSYGHRRPPFGNQARISSDHGRTWSEPVIISGDGANGDLGYPSTVELPGGELLTVWYEKPKDSPNAVLRSSRWRTSDFKV